MRILFLNLNLTKLLKFVNFKKLFKNYGLILLKYYLIIYKLI
jgi:hypothetical protein